MKPRRGAALGAQLRVTTEISYQNPCRQQGETGLSGRGGHSVQVQIGITAVYRQS